MLSLMKGVFEPSISYQDKIMYLTSLGLNLSISSDNNGIVVKNIYDLVSSKNTRYLGLQVLELTLQQSPDHMYSKGKFAVIIHQIIKDSRAAYLEKIQACRILAMLMPYMADDALSEVKDDLIKDIFPVLLEKIDGNVQWAEEACICVKMCLKTFPSDLAFYQSSLLNLILHQASYNNSSKVFEVLAECFCEIPYCSKDNHVQAIQGRWRELYSRTLKTIESLQVDCLKYTSGNDLEQPYEKSPIDATEFIFKKDSDDEVFFTAFLKRVRRFVNLSKCLAKLLSVKSKYPVKVPVEFTVKMLVPLYTDKSEKMANSQEEISRTFIAQMQLAGLAILEAVILNFNLQKNSYLIKDLIVVALRSCRTSMSSEPVSELRIGGWKLLSLWLEGFGCNVSKDIVGSQELLEDIFQDIDSNESLQKMQVSNVMQSHKSKKNLSSESCSKGVLIKKNQQKVCKAALNSLESLLYAGTLDFSKAVFQEICNRVFKICHAIHSSCDSFPFPYDDESCREQLYSVVLTIVVVSKPDDVQILQTAMKILAHINRDPSFKIRKFSNKASAIYRLQLYPKRPIPECSANKQRRPNVSNEISKYSEWASEEYVQNINAEDVSETSEIVNTNLDKTFQNQSEVEVQDYMEVETPYSEQVMENQCNGEDVSEIQSSSQGQDEDESEEEEEEEDEERCYGEEEIQEEPQEELYIPVPGNVQSVTESEYEKLTPCIKSEENVFKSAKDKCVNGENIPENDEDVPSSSSQQTIANENGIFGMDDDDLDEDNEEEEEEESDSCPVEKRVEPPLKRQKLETKDDLEVDERKESKSPTMDEMKADLLQLFPSVEDVRSGKVQLSS